MSARLISYTQFNPQYHEEKKTIEDIIVYCARVSNPESQSNQMNNERLINYLIDHCHWSPFEMVNICIEIETTREISRQILRHRSFSFQEFSQRYSVASLGFEFKEARLQDHKNRQNSISFDDPDLKSEWLEKQKQVIDLSHANYKWAIEKGIAKEQARVVLPEGNTLTKMYMNGSLRSWIHYIQLRSSKETQKEHRNVALACAKCIENIFPHIKKFMSVEK